MFRLSESIRTTFSAHFNLPISVSLYSQLSSTVPCCTRVKNTSRKLYILTFLQKLSRCERGTLTHFENKVDFKATHKFTRVNNIHNVSLVSSEEGYEYYQTVSEASYFFQIIFFKTVSDASEIFMFQVNFLHQRQFVSERQKFSNSFNLLVTLQKIIKFTFFKLLLVSETFMF